MIITYYGLTCFKLQSGETVAAFDPFSKESGLTPPRFQTHIALVTKPESPYHNNTEALTVTNLVITTPGEYETCGIVVEGAAANGSIIYTLEWEGLRICHLGAVGLETLPDTVRESIGIPDILFVPVGNGGALDAEAAATIVNQLEPRIVIPTYYKFSGLRSPSLEQPDAFLKEFGEYEKLDEKFTIKKKDVPQEKTMFVLLRPLAEKK